MHLNIYNFLHKILIIYDNIYMERERDLLILNNNKTSNKTKSNTKKKMQCFQPIFGKEDMCNADKHMK